MKNVKQNLVIATMCLLVAGLAGCIKQKEADRTFNVTVRNGQGFWNESWSTIKCDSFQMITRQQINIFVDGKKMYVTGTEISVSTSGL